MNQTKKITLKLPLKTAGSIAALLSASSANADIILSDDMGWSGFTVGDGGVDSYDWDLDSNGTTDLSFNQSLSNYLDIRLNGASLASNGLNSLQALGKSALIASSALTFGPTTTNILWSVFVGGELSYANGFTSGESTYIGFTFNPSGTDLFGWASVTLTKGTYGSFTVDNWAYDDSGASILAGQTTAAAVPEPSTSAMGLGALALGAAGLCRWRRNKQQSAA